MTIQATQAGQGHVVFGGLDGRIGCGDKSLLVADDVQLMAGIAAVPLVAVCAGDERMALQKVDLKLLKFGTPQRLSVC